MFQGGAPVLVLNTNTKRETGRKAQFANIMATKVRFLYIHILKIFKILPGYF